MKAETIIFGVLVCVGVATVWACIRRAKASSRNNALKPAHDTAEILAFKDAIARLEKRFIAVALTKIMSESSIPFEIRRKVWADYPCEHSDPVVGISSLANELGVSSEDVFAALSKWYVNVGIAPKGEMDSEIITRFLHQQAAEKANNILLSYLSNSKKVPNTSNIHQGRQ